MRPNIIFLMSDQQRWDSLGCYGNTFVHTPNLDRLAAQGVRFENAFTPYPVCTPARATMWTGVMPHKHQVIQNVYGSANVLPEIAAQGKDLFNVGVTDALSQVSKYRLRADAGSRIYHSVLRQVTFGRRRSGLLRCVGRLQFPGRTLGRRGAERGV